MTYSARFSLETGRLVGVVYTRDVPALSSDGVVYEALPDFFDPSSWYIQGEHRNFALRKIPSISRAEFDAEYPPARQLNIIRQTLAAVVDLDEHPVFKDLHEKMEMFNE